MKKLLAAAFAFWVVRWAVLELASLVANRLPPGPPPIDSPRQPGRMPGPFDATMDT